jgi:glutamine synthetase
MQAIEKKIADETQSQAHAAVVSAHSDADEVVASLDFQEWVMTSPSRQQRFADASNSYDAEAASDLITLYKSQSLDANKAATTQRDAKARAGLKAATTETGRPSAGESRKIYKRAELIKLKQYHPQKYTAMEPEIMLAYQEGRVK